MTAALSVAAGFVAGAGTAFAATPLAIRAARRAALYDHPHGYHQHTAPTPLLGGTAVIAGILVAAVAVGASGRLLVLLACSVGLCLVGTLDDRFPIAPSTRLLVETAAALALVSAGLHWEAPGGRVGDIALTVLWVVGLVNAFNLMDNLDGACGAVGCVSAAGIGALAAIYGAPTVAALAFALAGACLAFLHWNLARPARIFLGDGGSRPIGLLVAGLALATGRWRSGDASVLLGALMAGVVILDTTLVTVSRRRRGVTLMTGGRDHLTHRLLLVGRSPAAVAAGLASVQAILCALAIAGDRWSTQALEIIALTAASAGAVAIAVLDSPRWRPPGIAAPATSAAPVGSVAWASSTGDERR